jgi:hypothetical protein
MQITIIGDGQANLELTELEINIIENIFNLVKDTLDHEPEFKTRVGYDYLAAQQVVSSLSNNGIVDSGEVTLINNIFNEICNAIKTDNFEAQVGTSIVEAKSYLRAFNKLIKELN